jgi:prefoldin subunit 5
LAAQTGPTQIVTSDAAGNLATNTAAALGLATTSQVNAQVGGINSQLGIVNSQIGGINAQLGVINSQIGAINSQIGVINSQIGVINSQIGVINSQISSLSGRIDDVNNAARRGIAATAAMAYAPTPTGPGRTTLAINGSAYENTGGVGVAFQHRFASTRIPVYFSGAYGNGGGREHVGRAGVGIEW